MCSFIRKWAVLLSILEDLPKFLGLTKSQYIYILSQEQLQKVWLSLCIWHGIPEKAKKKIKVCEQEGFTFMHKQAGKHDPHRANNDDVNMNAWQSLVTAWCEQRSFVLGYKKTLQVGDKKKNNYIRVLNKTYLVKTVGDIDKLRVEKHTTDTTEISACVFFLCFKGVSKLGKHIT